MSKKVVEAVFGNTVFLVSAWDDRFALWARAERIQEIRSTPLTECVETRTPSGDVAVKLTFSAH